MLLAGFFCARLVRHLPGRQLSHLSHNPIVKRVFWRPLRYIAQDFDFAGEPRVAASLNVTRDNRVEKNENNQRSTSEGERGRQRDAPRGAVYPRLTGR